MTTPWRSRGSCEPCATLDSLRVILKLGQYPRMDLSAYFPAIIFEILIGTFFVYLPQLQEYSHQIFAEIFPHFEWVTYEEFWS